MTGPVTATASEAATVAVVVPAAGCACGQVERLARQVRSPDRLVVVWNGPAGTHDCAGVAAGLTSCTWLQHPRRLGPGGARGLGAAAVAAEVDILAFADSDDAVAADWLAELTRPIREGRDDLVGGVLRVQATGARAPRLVAPGTEFWHRQAVFGTSLAIRSSAWAQLGGFDPGLRCCEDTDLAWRAGDAGLRVGVAPRAMTAVTPRRPLAELVQRFRWGWWSIVLLRKHGLGADHLPSLRVLLGHKRAHGFQRHAVGAALGQWCGQWSGRGALLVSPGRRLRPGGRS